MSSSDESTYEVAIHGGELIPTIHLASSDSTVLDLKEEIEAELGIQVARQTLSTLQGLEMEDGNTIADYGHVSAVHLDFQLLPQDVSHRGIVFANPDDREIFVRGSDTVLQVKKRIEETLKVVKAEDITLWCIDSETTELLEHGEMKDQVTLSKYYIGVGRSRVSVKITYKPPCS